MVVERRDRQGAICDVGRDHSSAVDTQWRLFLRHLAYRTSDLCTPLSTHTTVSAVGAISHLGCDGLGILCANHHCRRCLVFLASQARHDRAEKDGVHFLTQTVAHRRPLPGPANDENAIRFL